MSFTVAIQSWPYVISAVFINTCYISLAGAFYSTIISSQFTISENFNNALHPLARGCLCSTHHHWWGPPHQVGGKRSSPKLNVCLLRPVPIPTVMDWVPQKENSETEISILEVVKEVLSGSGLCKGSSGVGETERSGLWWNPNWRSQPTPQGILKQD